MDQFGVLTQSLGLKPQGKSAPMAMAASSTSSRPKAAPFSTSSSDSTPHNNVVNNNHRDWEWDGYVDHLFGVGPSPDDAPPSSHNAGFGFDYDPVSSVSASISSSFSGFDQGDDVFGSMMTSKSNPPRMTDDLLEDFTQMVSQSNDINRKKSSNNNTVPPPPPPAAASSAHDDLIPGFGSGSDFSGTSSLNNSKTSLHAAENLVSSSIDELEIFAAAKVQSTANKQPDILSGEVDAGTFIDADMFGLKNKGSVHLEVEKERETARSAQRVNENDIESLFSNDAQIRSSPQPGAASDSVFDTLFQSRGGPDVSKFAGPSSNMKKDSSTINAMDDFSFMFGVGTTSAEFQEIDGENEERRAARWKRNQETKERMAKAVADMNQRDFQTQQEQEERHRVAETVNTEIRQWAAGKEGNLRALLSTLQSVLWPESAWQPVSLTDLITSTSVKKVYKKATLCIHPDKVQQKGANARQKYIAEKVFDLLKEAWNKFNAEELR